MIDEFRDSIKYGDLLIVRESQERELLAIDYWDDYRALEREFFPLVPTQPLDCKEIVRVGTGAIPGRPGALLSRMIHRLVPWRKGPFEILGMPIEAEWRSNLKWDRIEPLLGNVHGKRVGDVGCNNGYYLFRLLSHHPAIIIGLDPNARFYFQCELVRRLADVHSISFELLGIEHLDIFASFFDVLLCMGVVSHRRDPHAALLALYSALAPQGVLILENLTIEGNAGECLVPRDRYAMMRNVWNVPSPETLKGWALDAGFKEVEIVSSVRTSPVEQRQTVLSPYDSLSDFLDPNDTCKTVEGYPAPMRSVLRCQK